MVRLPYYNAESIFNALGLRIWNVFLLCRDIKSLVLLESFIDIHDCRQKQFCSNCNGDSGIFHKGWQEAVICVPIHVWLNFK